jgi:hypothetical protein
MTVFDFVKTPGTNRVRDPEDYTAMGRLKTQLWIGSIIDNYLYTIWQSLSGQP